MNDPLHSGKPAKVKAAPAEPVAPAPDVSPSTPAAALLAALLRAWPRLDQEARTEIAAQLEADLDGPYDDFPAKFAVLFEPRLSGPARAYGAWLLHLMLARPELRSRPLWIGPDLGGEDDAEALRLAWTDWDEPTLTAVAGEFRLVAAALGVSGRVVAARQASGDLKFELA